MRKLNSDERKREDPVGGTIDAGVPPHLAPSLSYRR